MTQTVHDAEQATASAHQAFLLVADGTSDLIGKQLSFQLKLIEELRNRTASCVQPREVKPKDNGARLSTRSQSVRPWLDRSQCLEFAVGKIGSVLGSEFAEIDRFPTRVRLPDEPLMLVDRILSIEGQKLSLTALARSWAGSLPGEPQRNPARTESRPSGIAQSRLEGGRVVTEHVIEPEAWYLDAGRIAPCIAIEAGQADLFLCGYLGVDFETKGLAVYRLLDATVTFHRPLPAAGEVIRYDIRITTFFRQGKTILFRFQFDATVGGEPLLTMRDGCAGFFTPEELAAGKGIVPRELDRRPRPARRQPLQTDWSPWRMSGSSVTRSTRCGAAIW